jgi:hypothetical protein
MKSKTQLKLQEALFFLEKMEEFYTVNPDFDYYFNAFISSGRSVTFVMQKEYSKIQGFEEWYENRVLNEKENTLLKKLSIDLRNTSIHLKSLTTTLEYIFLIPDHININEDNQYQIFVKKKKKKFLKKFIDRKSKIKQNEIKNDNASPKFTSKVQTLRVLKISEELKSPKEGEIDEARKNKNYVIDFISKPTKLYDLENNVLYLCWEYYNWLNDIVAECENLFIHE